jgi:hypothetical protein
MMSSVLADVDLIEELRLRRWAREHYVPRNQRQSAWHPIVHEEMSRRDLENSEADLTPAYACPKR